MQRTQSSILLASLENRLVEIVGVRERRGVRSKSAEVLGGGSGWRRTLESLVRIWIFFPDMGPMAGSFFLKKCIFIYLALPGPSVTACECLVASCIP